MYTIVSDYRQFIEELPKRIKKSSFKPIKLIEKTGIPKASFYKKLKENNFTISEVEKISRVLYTEDLIDAQIKASEDDIQNRLFSEGAEKIDDLIEKLEGKRRS